MKKIITWERLINFGLASVIFTLAYFVLQIELNHSIIMGAASFPWKIPDRMADLFTLGTSGDRYGFFGGVNKNGKIISFMPFFQYSNGDAESIWSIFLFFQKSKNGEAFSYLGAPLYQKALHSATFLIGISLYQKSELDSAGYLFGISAYTDSGYDSWCGIGIPIFQKAVHKARCFIGFNFRQIAKIESIFIGVSFYRLFQLFKKQLKLKEAN